MYKIKTVPSDRIQLSSGGTVLLEIRSLDECDKLIEELKLARDDVWPNNVVHKCMYTDWAVDGRKCDSLATHKIVGRKGSVADTVYSCVNHIAELRDEGENVIPI